MARRMKRDRIVMLREDLKKLILDDGDTVTFIWKEMTGGVWNDAYEVWEGGIEAEKSFAIKGLGKVIDYKQDQMEYEYMRLNVGDCIIRFPYDANLTPIKNKESVRFRYKGEKWKIDSPIDIGDMYNDQLYSIAIKGMKSTD